MTEAEDQLKQQQVERNSLQNTISDLRGALMFAVGDGRQVLETALRNATGRLGGVEMRLKSLQEAREAETKQAADRAVYLAEKEKLLSSEERGTFAGFLRKDRFTKADFASLDKFYSNTWERLSEEGKDEMSHRVWEGVRHGEYNFLELPKPVRAKEAERAFNRLNERAVGSDEASRILKGDIDDFVSAYKAGRREEAEKVLNRESFKQNMFRGAEPASRSHASAEVGQEAARAKAATAVDEVMKQSNELQQVKGSKQAAAKLSKLSLDGLELAEVRQQGSSADLPSAKEVVQGSAVTRK